MGHFDTQLRGLLEPRTYFPHGYARDPAGIYFGTTSGEVWGSRDEGRIRGHPAEYRHRIRQERSRPIVEALHDWLHTHISRVPGASDLAKAMRYAIRHWPGLIAFLDDGRIEMDTNTVERSIRPHTLLRKNALFAGSDGGARHWSVAMSLIHTAKLNGVDPMVWLTDVLERIVSGRTKANQLRTLLPWNWCPANNVELAEAA